MPDNPKVEIDPWGSSDVQDYDYLFREFGIEPFSKVAGSLKQPHILMNRGVVFGQRDFSRIADAMNKKKPFAMMTGLMPSGKFHMGHKLVADQMIYYQEQGADLYVCVADLEAYLTRGMSLEETRKLAIEEYLINYIALGLKPKKCHFYFQTNGSVAYNNLSKFVSKKITFNEIRAIYGDITPGKIISALTQVADILHPQLEENGGPKAVVVPVGVDQDPHLRLTRDITSRLQNEFGFVLPSSTYHKFMKGLDGGKMSSSRPTSYIALTDSPEEAANKIKKYAFSGGQATIEEHRKLGGNPDVDVSYHYLTFFETDEKKLRKIYDDYKSGKLLTGELKQITIEKIASFLKEHQKKREKAKKEVKKFLKD